MQQLKTFLVDISSPRERRLGEQFVFGARETIIHALGIHPQTLFLANLQHGWIDNTFQHHRPRVFNHKGIAYMDFVWSGRGHREMKNAGRERTLAVGAPWAHLANYIEKNYSPKTQKKSGQTKLITYFPSHSHHGWETPISTDLKATYSNEFQYRYCLYWLDYLNTDLRNAIKNQGFDVVCAGFRGSSGNEIPWADVGGRSVFLLNLWEIIHESNVIICDDISSAFWYAVSLNKPTIVLKTNSYSRIWNSSDLRNPTLHVQENDKILKRHGIQYSFDGSPLNSRGELTDLARAELGWEFARNPSVFFEKMRHHSAIDRRIPEKYLETYREKLTRLFDQLDRPLF